MREADLRRADLNLLVALDALLEERNVTRAAQRLGISQPAASRALGRLRALFSDALLVDGAGGYVLSARAEEVRPQLRTILGSVGELLDSRAFDPKAATGRVRLLMPDLQAAALTPGLLALLDREAPSLDLEIVAPGANPIEALEQGVADAMVGLIDEAPAGTQRRRLYDETLVTLLRANHPALARKLTLDRYLALDHIVVSVTGVGAAPVDEVLARMGRTRRVKLRVPNFFAAVEIAARSDLVMTLPASLARAAADMRRFVSLPPPLDLGRYSMSLVWHARQQDSPRHLWLRRAIVTAATGMSSADHRVAATPRR
ncbi:LysR family transcriptional regulator [Elioraea rosea]|uniref:LysR family transcriptional regulator n=1 Tax=Elioraea rosea TaxID=2492390 RepID=UPI001183E8A6|nr:LysR family transcriptional regulator [Elioraea rosea]